MRYLVFCAALALAMSGCADLARWMRKYTYPPDFRYIERHQLRSAMEQLALHVRGLDQALQAPAPGDQERQAILEHLHGMDKATLSLDTSGWPSNHPLVDINMPRFRQDIRRALDAVERTPPNYTFARALPGACVYCHGGR